MAKRVLVWPTELYFRENLEGPAVSARRRGGTMSAMRTPTRQAPPSPVGVVNGREIVDHRLRWRILLTCLLATAITHVQVLAARPRFPTTEMWRTAAVVATIPLTSLVVACVSPAASPWRSATSADGQIYYYNAMTNETSWDKPPGMP